ncbi:hypothetical protein AB0O68_15800 [Streptomyces sp. NPDC087512]|uniref:hypothetical protein n=1 Tax=Streptomyces sp. NPDC087512 TaxID=3155059 RepID=UPI00343B99B8
MSPVFRCTATTKVAADIQALAETISSPHESVEWAGHQVLQCLLEAVDHDFHAAFLRTGARVTSDVFLCWSTDGRQTLADLDCCMNKRTKLGTGCTIFQHHPGRCDWDYIDPVMEAAQAEADQLAEELGLSRAFRGARKAPPA